MSEKTAYEAYQKFLSLKQHFSKNNSYNYFKYNGKVRTNLNSFRTKNTRYFFEAISRKYTSEQELIGFYVCNLIKEPDIWIGELVRNKECDERYVQWKKKKEALTYLFKCDILTLNETVDNFNSLFRCRQNEYPILIDAYNENDISLETLIGIDHVLNCFDEWNKTLSGDIIWQDLYHLCVCYKPFLSYNESIRMKYREILKKEFTSGQN